MCKFCDNLEWRSYKIPVRSQGACDNLCEIMTAKFEKYADEYVCLGSECAGCDGCADNGFGMRSYDNRIGFTFDQKIKELHISRYSEMLDINFCPWCGKRLSKDNEFFEKCMLGMELERIK